MLDVIQVAGPVVAFRAEGTLTAADYDRMTAEIDRQLSAHERVGLFADMSGLEGLSLSAIGRDLAYSVGKLGELHRLDRVAVVSDKTWLRAWSQLAWMLVPKSTVRTFEHADREAALAWTAELVDEPPKRGLRWIETSRSDVYAVEWNGTITREDVDQVFSKLEQGLQTHAKVRLLTRIEHLHGFRPQALFNGTYARVKLLGLQKVERYAVITGSEWLARYIELVGRWTGIDIRHFTREREHEAWTWLQAQPAFAPTVLHA